MATKQPVVVEAPLSPTVTDEFGNMTKRACQSVGITFEISYRSLWCLNEEIIGKQEEIILVNGGKTSKLIDNYPGDREEALAKVAYVRSM